MQNKTFKWFDGKETCDEELPEYNDDDGSDYDDHEDRDEDAEKDEKFVVDIKRLKWICPKEPKRPSRERKVSDSHKSSSTHYNTYIIKKNDSFGLNNCQ